MPKEKRAINIHIEDLDDLDKLWVALDNLFRQILEYYIDTDFEKLVKFVLSCSVYFGKLLNILGYSEKDFSNE
jgi:hypothetical protein